MASYTTGEPQEGGGSFLVPAGEYTLKTIDAEEGRSQAGNDMIKAVFRVLYDDGSEGPKIYENLVFSEKTNWRVDQFVAACGKHPGKGVKFDLFPSMIHGWTFRAKLKVERYNEKDRNKVEEFLITEAPAQGGGQRQAAPTRTAAPAPAEDDGDHVPF